MSKDLDKTVGTIGNKTILASLNAIWKDQRYAYDASGTIIYRGVSIYHGNGTTEEDWEIWKYSYDGSGNLTRIEGPLKGSWDGRAALGWT